MFFKVSFLKKKQLKVNFFIKKQGFWVKIQKNDVN